MSDRFHHLSLAPKDWEKTVAFYRETLGWSTTESWGGRGEPRGAILSGGGVKVVIVEDGAVDGQGATPRLHLDIHNIDARFRDIGSGAHVVKPPEDTPWGTRWFVLRDPDGNLIAFEEVHRHGR